VIVWKLRYSAFRLIGETIGVFHRCGRITITVYLNKIKNLLASAYNFSTGSPQKLWKIQKPCQAFLLFLHLSLFLVVGGCSGSSAYQKATKQVAQPTLISASEEEVKQALGEPDTVAKTPDGSTLFIYRPPWKIYPSPKDTVYVEFDNGKVAKIFKIR
jgi:hypothetical protein